MNGIRYREHRRRGAARQSQCRRSQTSRSHKGSGHWAGGEKDAMRRERRSPQEGLNEYVHEYSMFNRSHVSNTAHVRMGDVQMTKLTAERMSSVREQRSRVHVPSRSPLRARQQNVRTKPNQRYPTPSISCPHGAQSQISIGTEVWYKTVRTDALL